MITEFLINAALNPKLPIKVREVILICIPEFKLLQIAADSKDPEILRKLYNLIYQIETRRISYYLSGRILHILLYNPFLPKDCLVEVAANVHSVFHPALRGLSKRYPHFEEYYLISNASRFIYWLDNDRLDNVGYSAMYRWPLIKNG